MWGRLNYFTPEKSKKKENFILAQHFIPKCWRKGDKKKSTSSQSAELYSGHILQHQPKLWVLRLIEVTHKSEKEKSTGFIDIIFDGFSIDKM